jgi:hypothetical protein
MIRKLCPMKRTKKPKAVSRLKTVHRDLVRINHHQSKLNKERDLLVVEEDAAVEDNREPTEKHVNFDQENHAVISKKVNLAPPEAKARLLVAEEEEEVAEVTASLVAMVSANLASIFLVLVASIILKKENADLEVLVVIITMERLMANPPPENIITRVAAAVAVDEVAEAGTVNTILPLVRTPLQKVPPLILKLLVASIPTLAKID